MEGLWDTLTVARAESSRTLRSARALILFGLFALFTALVLLVAGGAEDESVAKIRAADPSMRSELLQMRSLTLGSLYDFDPALLDAFLDIPVGILVVFKVALFFLPAYIALLGFDQLSGELGSRSVRYLAVRASRSSILLGKLLAQAAVLTALLFGVNGVLFVYAWAVNDWFSLGMMLATGFKFWLASVLFSLAWLSLTSLCSALFRAPALSLVTNFLLMFVLLVLSVVSAFGTGPEAMAGGMPGPAERTSWVGYLDLASPFHYGNGLLHPDPGAFAASGGAMLAFCAVFLLVAWASLRARDL